jgi:hypothetical protein
VFGIDQPIAVMRQAGACPQDIAGEIVHWDAGLIGAQVCALSKRLWRRRLYVGGRFSA